MHDQAIAEVEEFLPTGKVYDLFALSAAYIRLHSAMVDYFDEVQGHANNPEKVSFAASRALLAIRETN